MPAQNASDQSPRTRATLLGVSAPAAPRIDARSMAAIVFTLIFWASAFAGIRAGLEAFGPGQLALYRFLVASLVLGAYALVTRIPVPPLGVLLRILGLSFLGITLYHVLLNYGEVSVPARTASLIVAAGPSITALLATQFAGERLNAWGWLGTAVAFAGVALIVLGSGQGVQFTQGAILIFLAAVVTSVYFVFQRPLLRHMNPLHFTVWSLMLGTLPMLVFLPGLLRELLAAPLHTHLAVVYLGIFPSALAYLAWSYALSRVPASVTTSFLYVNPVNAILIGWVWLREVPTRMSLLGGLIAIAGVVLLNLRGRPREGAA